MTVYVDDVEHEFKKNAFRTYKMCHLWADSLDELLAFVDRIGVARRWLQQPPKASWVHFDIAKSKKRTALRLGAVLTDRYGPVEHVARLKGNQAKVDQIARIRAMADYTPPVNPWPRKEKPEPAQDRLL